MSSRLCCDGVLFDLGNTLIPFTPRDSMEFVTKWYMASIKDTKMIPFNIFLDSYRSIVREEKKLSNGGAWESSVRDRSRMITDALEKKNIEIKRDLMKRLISTHSNEFTSCLRIDKPSKNVLDLLGSSTNENGDPIKMGLISNAIDGKAVRSFLEKKDLKEYFEVIIISQEVGLAKPKKEIFDMALDRMSLSPNRSFYVGDRYFTDVIGARNAGMNSVYIRQYHTAGEPPKGQIIDAPIIKNIVDLVPLLRDDSFPR